MVSARPFLVLYVVWHQGFNQGPAIANALREHFSRKLYENIAGGTGLNVVYRFTPAPSSNVPLPINLNDSETTAIVVLCDNLLAKDPDWSNYVKELIAQVNKQGLSTRVFPVSIDRDALVALGIREQAIRWDTWSGSFETLSMRLNAALTYDFSRMLRHYLAHLRHPKEEFEALEQYLKKVQIFLSHSKHDEDGVRIAKAIRDDLYNNNGLSGFFDVYDIPTGLPFDKVILHQVRVSAVVAIHTDSYSSREWCRKEIIEAKRWSVPLVIANCISDIDERGFPYLGNVPVVRLDPIAVDRIEYIVARLLDEVLKDFLWRCQIENLLHSDSSVIFIPRPPELICLANLPAIDKNPAPLIVYPDPPMSAEEERLFEAVAPHVQLRSLSEWKAGVIR